MGSSVLPLLLRGAPRSGGVTTGRAKLEDQASAFDAGEGYLSRALPVDDRYGGVCDRPNRSDDHALAGAGLRRRGGVAESELGLLAGESHEVTLGAQTALDAWRAHFEVIRVRDQVCDVEGRAEIARDAGAEREVNRRVADG